MSTQSSDLQKWYQTHKMQTQKGLQTATCPYLCATLTGRVRPEWEHTWNQLQIFPNMSPAPECHLPRLHPAYCAGCSPPLYGNARKVSLRSNEVYRQNYLTVGIIMMSTAQERHLLSLQSQISADEFEHWSCFIHIM